MGFDTAIVDILAWYILFVLDSDLKALKPAVR
jgi:hypothetical protein